jgi:hypothetical protein
MTDGIGPDAVNLTICAMMRVIKLENFLCYRRVRRDKEGLILCVLGGLCGERWFF